MRFGNKMHLIKKLIFFCKLLGCKKIILSKNKNWFIKNRLINKKYKMIIDVKNEKSIQNPNIIIDRTSNFFYYKILFRPEMDFESLKEEILKNLPKVNTERYDLHIYIRSGDIFIKPHHRYSQAPLCFYENILNNYEFKKVFIIAENKNNPIIDKLLIQYPNIIYNKNSLKIDIAYLSFTYNLVGGKISTFLENIIPLNHNLQYLWIFNTQPVEKKNKKINILNLYNKIKIFQMDASENYIKEMKNWKNNKFQRDLMINEKCINKFY